MVVVSILENDFEDTWRWKTIALRVQMWHFSGKAKYIPQNGFILKFARASILEIGFEATLKSKTNVLDIWIWIFRDFFHIFQWTKENLFEESKAKHTKLCKSEVSHRKYFRKLFRNYLDVKSRCTTEPLKQETFSLLHIFKSRSWNGLLWKQSKAFKSLWIQSWLW